MFLLCAQGNSCGVCKEDTFVVGRAIADGLEHFDHRTSPAGRLFSNTSRPGVTPCPKYSKCMQWLSIHVLQTCLHVDFYLLGHFYNCQGQWSRIAEAGGTRCQRSQVEEIVGLELLIPRRFPKTCCLLWKLCSMLWTVQEDCVRGLPSLEDQ